MEQIRLAHQAFDHAWTDAQTTALKSLSPADDATSWGEILKTNSIAEILKANAIAYRSAEPLMSRRNRLIVELFQEHLDPLDQALARGDPDAVHAIIDFLEVDVPAFRCGYTKEEYLRRLKRIQLTSEHRDRLRKYGVGLCGAAHHRREIAEAGRLMILVANREFVEQLRAVAGSENTWISKRANKMLNVVQNGRKDLR